MSVGNFFLDTNILFYAMHVEPSDKRESAKKLMVRAEEGGGFISFQVVQEYTNLMLKKFKPTPPLEEIRNTLRDILLPLCRILPNPAFYLEALDTQQLTRFSWYDSLILQAAVDARCDILYSEDLQDGFKFRGVTIKNPFK